MITKLRFFTLLEQSLQLKACVKFITYCNLEARYYMLHVKKKHGDLTPIDRKAIQFLAIEFFKCR